MYKENVYISHETCLLVCTFSAASTVVVWFNEEKKKKKVGSPSVKNATFSTTR